MFFSFIRDGKSTATTSHCIWFCVVLTSQASSSSSSGEVHTHRLATLQRLIYLDMEAETKLLLIQDIVMSWPMTRNQTPLRESDDNTRGLKRTTTGEPVVASPSGGHFVTQQSFRIYFLKISEQLMQHSCYRTGPGTHNHNDTRHRTF